MGEIKSALERALEKTAEIKADPESLRRKEAQDDGKRLYVKVRDDDAFDLNAAIAGYPADRRASVRDGLVGAALNNLTLPKSEADLPTVEIVARALRPLVNDASALEALIGQIRDFYSQYLDDRRQLIEGLRKQLEPHVRQKEQQLAAQYGRAVRVDPATDPEFGKLFSERLGQLDSQYQAALRQVDDHLRTMAGAAARA